MSPPVFDRYAAFYDLLYRDKDYPAEADYVARTLTAHGTSRGDVLEFGSGTGKHGRLLAARGFGVLGLERSDAMIAQAHAAPTTPAADTRGTFRCQAGDFTTAQLGRTFDAILALFHVVNYQTTDAALRETFARTALHLKPGGLFFFDVWHGPAVLADPPAVRTKRAEDDRVRLVRHATPTLDLAARTVAVHYALHIEDKPSGRTEVLEETHHMRYLFPDEIQRLAHDAGFRLELAEEFLTGRAPSEQTWGVAYLLRKIPAPAPARPAAP